MKIRRLLPLLVIVAGIFYSLFLLRQIPEGVYFSGDAGLKALLSEQLAQGTGRLDLIPPALAWVKDLWNAGLYPYQPPYAYHLGDRYFITFPYTFPWVTAPFFRLWGYYGLYVIPLLGTWVVWGLFYGACRLLRFSTSLTGLGLGLLIFASPLTLYSAMYWEHSLAVALGFGSLVLMGWARQQRSARWQVFVSGVGLGLAVAFRPEFLAVLALAIAIAWGQALLNLQWVKKWLKQLYRKPIPDQDLEFIPHPGIFSLSAIGTALLFFGSNQLIYGHYLGIHGLQAIEKVTLGQKFKNAIAGVEGMGGTFLVFMPIISFFLFYCLFLLINRSRIKPDWLLLSIYGLSLLLLGLIAFLVPPGTEGLIAGGKQWGTRFLLFLVPILLLATLAAFRHILQSEKPWLKYAGIACFSGLLWLSFQKNTLEGTAYLHKSYQNIAPAIAFLTDQPDSVIAVSHQFVGQVLQAPVKGEKLWFIAADINQLTKLTQALHQQNIARFLYVCYPFAPCPLPQLPSDRLRLGNGPSAQSVHFEFLGKKGKYPVYQGFISVN
jgi:hypothetical protein